MCAAVRLCRLFCRLTFRNRNAVGEVERRFKRLRQARFNPVFDDDTINDDFDIVLDLFVEGGNVGDFVILAVDFDALKAFFLKFGEFFAVFAFAAANNRREEIKTRAFAFFQQTVDHFGHGLRCDRQTSCGRIRNADARPEEAHVVVNLGDGAHRRTRVA